MVFHSVPKSRKGALKCTMLSHVVQTVKGKLKGKLLPVSSIFHKMSICKFMVYLTNTSATVTNGSNGTPLFCVHGPGAKVAKGLFNLKSMRVSFSKYSKITFCLGASEKRTGYQADAIP